MPAKHLHLVPSYAVDLVLPITRNRTSSTSALVGSLALEKIAKMVQCGLGKPFRRLKVVLNSMIKGGAIGDDYTRFISVPQMR